MARTNRNKCFLFQSSVLLIWFPAPVHSMLKCPWARHGASNCSWWAGRHIAWPLSYHQCMNLCLCAWVNARHCKVLCSALGIKALYKCGQCTVCHHTQSFTYSPPSPEQLHIKYLACRHLHSGKSVFHSLFMSEIWASDLPSKLCCFNTAFSGTGLGKWNKINVDNTMWYEEQQLVKKICLVTILGKLTKSKFCFWCLWPPAWGYSSVLRGEHELSSHWKTRKSLQDQKHEAFTADKEWFYEFIEHLVELLYPIKPYFTQC